VKQPSQIEHKGTVASVGRNVVRVDIEVMEACGSCASRKACAMGQGTTREILVYAEDAGSYSVGEVVRVAARQSMGVMAVLLCYVLPLVVLVAVLAIAVLSGLSEGLSAIVTLCFLVLYYAVLALFRNNIASKVVFTINKI
jgi:sigma-E factor negative regulatory protein RseC